MEDQKGQKNDYFLDIRDEVCPMTFVKTKLLLERVEPGALLEVRLKGAEPLENVPRSVEDMGHVVVSCDDDHDGGHRLVIRKSAGPGP